MSPGTASPEDLVREVLARSRSWDAVAGAFSVIAEDLQWPAKMTGRDLAMRNQVARFLVSADRHLGRVPEVSTSQFGATSPKRLMTLAEAYAFVTRLSMAWRAQRQRAAA